MYVYMYINADIYEALIVEIKIQYFIKVNPGLKQYALDPKPTFLEIPGLKCQSFSKMNSGFRSILKLRTFITVA